mmetsp:Transcript_73517/g.85406  ORF Transcript_73517/g.85406 Transcript_73517/m.85406 type:complete len:87 (+) Transcript_73517:399-659(+)
MRRSAARLFGNEAHFVHKATVGGGGQRLFCDRSVLRLRERVADVHRCVSRGKKEEICGKDDRNRGKLSSHTDKKVNNAVFDFSFLQ